MKKVILILLLIIPTLMLAQSVTVKGSTWTATSGKTVVASLAGGEQSAEIAVELRGENFIVYGGFNKALVYAGKLNKECKFKPNKKTYEFTILKVGDSFPEGRIVFNYKEGYAEIEFQDVNGDRVTITLFNPEFVTDEE